MVTEFEKTKKKVIKVFVNQGNDSLSQVSADGKEHNGVMYDIWKLVKEKLNNKYIFKEEFGEMSNYDKMVSDTAAGKYDLIIAPFSLTKERFEKINYTSNIILGKITILHLPKLTIYQQILSIYDNIVKGPLIILLISGFILALLLYYFEPKRYIKARAKDKYAWRRTLATVIASLFGEAGFLSENSTLSIPGLLIVLFIMIFAFFFVMLLQAYVTDKVISINENNTYTRENIKNQVLLCPEGYAVGKFMQRYGAKIEYHNKTIKELKEYYIKNKEKYIGISLDYFDAINEETDDLVTSTSPFGYSKMKWIVNKKYNTLLEDINYTLIPIHFNLYTYRICKKYVNDHDARLCNI